MQVVPWTDRVTRSGATLERAAGSVGADVARALMG
jgi:hypothetical protein